nr:MAG TPA: hypothetical protein [Crassvirales sp.]
MYKFNIEFGDVSKNGHCMTSVFGLECSVDKEELEELFDKACESTSFNFAYEICNDYSTYQIDIDYLHELKEEKNVDLLSIVEGIGYYNEEDGTYDVEYNKDFLEIFLEFTRKYGGKDFTYKIVPQIQDRLAINMGYGLFSD